MVSLISLHGTGQSVGESVYEVEHDLAQPKRYIGSFAQSYLAT